jgi:hypothetical protein
MLQKQIKVAVWNSWELFTLQIKPPNPKRSKILTNDAVDLKF